MTEETIGGFATSSASHCAAKSRGVASPALAATAGPKLSRILVVAFAMRRWIGDPQIELKRPVALGAHFISPEH